MLNRKIMKNGLYHKDSTLIDFKRNVHKLALDYLDMYKRSMIHKMSSDELRREAKNAVITVIKDNSLILPASVKHDEVIESIVAEAIGLGPLEQLLIDDEITEVMVNGPDEIFIEKNGSILQTNLFFNGHESLMGIIERIVSPLGRHINESSPMVDARLEDGSRVNAIIPPLSLTGPVLTIRKFPNKSYIIDDLITNKTLSQNMADFLKVCVLNRKNIIISGGTGTGKTTLLNILADYIPETERIITIEDAAELKLHQQHVITLECRPANIEGKGNITVRDLVKNSLRMRPDRIVVGECRGGESLDMLQAMNTGHEGSLTTAHANSARDCLSRLEVMVLMAGFDLPVNAIREQIVSAIDIIIQLTRYSDGSRRVTNIVEVDGMEGDKILLHEIYRFNKQGIDEYGEIHGSFTGSGFAPNFYQELEETGISVDRGLFSTVQGGF